MNEELDVACLLSYALRMKEEGNAAFQRGQYADAEERYNTALEALDGAPAAILEVRVLMLTVYANRAQLSINQGSFEEALIRCAQALALDPYHVKALYRRGVAAAKVARCDIREDSVVRLRALGCGPDADALQAL